MLPYWTENDLTLLDARLHVYRTSATGDGRPPLVLVHGFSDDGLCWAPTAQDLQSQFDVLMPDAIGHGRSQRVQRGQPTDMAANLAGLMQALQLAPAVVAGHSMGGVVAAQLAARFPQQVRALILEDPAWFSHGVGGASGALFDENSPTGDWVRSLQSLSLEQIVAQSRREHPTWPENALYPWCVAKTRLDPDFLTTHDLAWQGWQEVAQRIACPTLLITADPERGSILTPALVAQVQALNPRFHVVHVAGAGHHVRFEQYAAYMAAVHAFLTELA